MKDAVLLELARKWDRQAKRPQCEDGAPSAQRENDIAAGVRSGHDTCANELRALIELLGGE